MDKDKLIKGLIWLSVTSLTILLDATLLYIGFNNMEHGSYTILVLGVILLPLIFFCAFKGIKNTLDAIFY
ncbi:MAG: DUF6095 family protein [Flavobacteriales bacterium]|jgi:hypothetical protein|nr:DUF6095 family protein [Flavobacteriales bacterium]HJN63576.1 DUF6095 family protein [Flavobacteriales bacterium]|tara:strand:+ start:175 stop:384 length:210 start_codon:yes stop_codon:yes gene_type:complete